MSPGVAVASAGSVADLAILVLGSPASSGSLGRYRLRPLPVPPVPPHPRGASSSLSCGLCPPVHGCRTLSQGDTFRGPAGGRPLTSLEASPASARSFLQRCCPESRCSFAVWALAGLLALGLSGRFALAAVGAADSGSPEDVTKFALRAGRTFGCPCVFDEFVIGGVRVAPLVFV